MLLMAVVAVVFFVRCYEHEPSGDELLYEYVWEDGDPTDLWMRGHQFINKVSSLEDIYNTQVKHYMLVNGRSLVHAVEQAFTGHKLAFSLVNTGVFLLFVFMIVNFVTGKNRRNRYWVWFSVVTGLLLMFPYEESLWTSVNLGLNYLWPATMSVAMLTIWKSAINAPPSHTHSLRTSEAGNLRAIKGRRAVENVLIVLLSAVFGWTHEGFVVGVAGGMFLYYCFHFRDYRGRAVLLTVPMWLTAIVMVFAPGNLMRFFGGGDKVGSPFYIKFTNGFDNLLHLWFIWIALAVVIILLAFHRRALLAQYLRRCNYLLWVLGVSFVFSMVANTAPYSHTFVELMFFIMVLGYFSQKRIKVSYRITFVLGSVATMLFVFQQLVLAKDTIHNYNMQRLMRQEYVESHDGITLLKMPEVNAVSRPFIRLWDEDGFYTQSLMAHTNSKTRPVFLTEPDYKAVKRPDDFFVPENKAFKDVPVYKSPNGVFYWVHPDSIKGLEALEADLYPVSWDLEAQLLVKIKFALFPELYPSSEELKIDTIHADKGDAYRVVMPKVRKVKDLKSIATNR